MTPSITIQHYPIILNKNLFINIAYYIIVSNFIYSPQKDLHQKERKKKKRTDKETRNRQK